MKTFFLALILGIFVGSIITNYFADPEAYQHLKEAKARLFAQDSTEEMPANTPEESLSSEPARFDVGSGKLEENQETEEPSSAPLPLPKPTPNTNSPAAETSKEDAAAIEEKAPEPQVPDVDPTSEAEPPAVPLSEAAKPEAENPPAAKSRSEELIEQGTKKAEEIADTVAEKAKEVAKEAQPIIEEGIDMTIAAGIRAQYKLERRINSDAIKISVKDNIVTLSGTVDSEATKKLAIEIAVFTKGVDGVEETLSIAE